MTTPPDLVEQHVAANARASVEQFFFIDVISFDWNRPKSLRERKKGAFLQRLYLEIIDDINERDEPDVIFRFK